MGKDGLVNAVILCIRQASLHNLPVYACICCQGPYSEVAIGKGFCSVGFVDFMHKWR